jgi:hypothetical protein
MDLLSIIWSCFWDKNHFDELIEPSLREQMKPLYYHSACGYGYDNEKKKFVWFEESKNA